MAQVSQSDVVPSFKDAYVAISTDGTTFTDISGYAASVAVSGGERATGEEYSFDGDTPVMGVGKRGPYELTIRILYTEDSAQYYYTLLGAYRNATDYYVRYAPKGNSAGNWAWTTTVGTFTSCPPPAGEAGSGDPIAVEATFRCADIERSNLAS